MDPTNCLDRILSAYAHDDIDEFNAAARDLESWHNKGGFLPAQLQSFADDMRFDLDRLPVATGRRDDDDDDDATLDFRVYIRPEATLELQTGDASYDTDHRGDIGAGSVSPHDDDDDIRRAVYDAFAEAVGSAVQSFAACGTFGVARQV